MKIYCTNCGKGAEVGLTKPNFCGSCGVAVSAKASVQQKLAPKVKIEVEEAEEEDEEIEASAQENETVGPVEKIPDISQLDVDILEAPKKQKISDLMGTPSRRNNDDFVGGESPAIDKKNFWENFKKEAGQSRPK